MKKDKRFFSNLIIPIAVFVSVFSICDSVNAATRANSRTAPGLKKVIITADTTAQEQEPEATNTEVIETEPVVEQPEEVYQVEPIIENKSAMFEDVVSMVMESATEDNSFAEQIRRQRAALAASESTSAANSAQQKALATNNSSCDASLRKCMSEICGKDFTKCALDGDTIFGDKLNKCRRNAECSGEEFNLFSTEIKSDRDTNVRLASYNAVLDCGNNYNACIVNECGNTYNKCLGKTAADAAVQKCSIIAKECSEADSGLAARFGTAIGQLRENAEKDIKKDENRLYALRDSMSARCKSLGAAFDDRSFDCVYTVEFFAGSNQSTPTASRKVYAGDSFVCMQEWFGINATTFKENAYRETRSQTAASSAMLGSGLGTAAGLISSGAIDRAIDTQNAKKDLKEECKAQGGTLKNGECIAKDSKKASDAEPKNVDNAPANNNGKQTNQTNQTNKATSEPNTPKSNTAKAGDDCTSKVAHATKAKYNRSLDCIVDTCEKDYKKSTNKKYCIEKSKK